MDEPMLKPRHPVFVPGCPSGSVTTGSVSDDGSAILAMNSNRRCRSSFLRSLYSGPVAFHTALCSMLISMALCFMMAWLWHQELPSQLERIALLEKKLELADAFLIEQKRAMHFLRKEVLFTSTRLQSMSAYEAYKREEDAEMGSQDNMFRPGAGSGFYPQQNIDAKNTQQYSSMTYDSGNKDWKRNKGYYYQQQQGQGMEYQWSTQAPMMTSKNGAEMNNEQDKKPLKDVVAENDGNFGKIQDVGQDNAATTPFW